MEPIFWSLRNNVGEIFRRSAMRWESLCLEPHPTPEQRLEQLYALKEDAEAVLDNVKNLIEEAEGVEVTTEAFSEQQERQIKGD